MYIKTNFRKVSIGLLLALLLLGLNSCVTRSRCAKKFPLETVTIIKDSIIYLPGPSFDTTFSTPGDRDTFYLHDTITNIRVRYVKLPGDTVSIFVKCPDDSLKTTTSITTSTGFPEPPPKPEKSMPAWLITLFVILLLLSGGYFINSIKRKI